MRHLRDSPYEAANGKGNDKFHPARISRPNSEIERLPNDTVPKAGIGDGISVLVHALVRQNRRDSRQTRLSFSTIAKRDERWHMCNGNAAPGI